MAKFIPFTEDDKLRASSVNLVNYLQLRGEQLQPIGRAYKLIYTDSSGVHDSITLSENRWYDHKNQIGGGPIKFLTTHYGMSYADAMTELLGGQFQICNDSNVKNIFTGVKKNNNEFILPDANDNMRRVFAYLTKQRCIDPDIISSFAHEKLIYEDKAHHNAVFVGADETGTPKQAHVRSTLSFGKTFRITVLGSDTKYSFSHYGTDDKLYVFEAPIDMLSYISMHKDNWQEHSYIAMNGVYESSVIHALDKHSNLNTVYICVDNDEGGIEAVDRLRDILSEHGYNDVQRLCPKNKDWNEDIKEQHGMIPLPAVPHMRKECYESLVNTVQFRTNSTTKLTAMLNAAMLAEDYKFMGTIALSAAATLTRTFSDNKQSDNDVFIKLKESLLTQYKPYTDKSSFGAKYERLQTQNKVVYEMIKKANTYPANVMRAIAKSLYTLADSAFRCETDNIMKSIKCEQESIQETDEEPDAEQGLCISM